MAKLILLLLIAGSMALFAVSNQTPISLVVLGIRTPTLPLAVWVLGALLAGATTTVLLSGFSSLSKGAAVRRASQPPRDRSPWTAARGEDKTQTSPRNSTQTGSQTSSGRTSSRGDDWDRDQAAWDNWGEPSQPPPTPRSEPSSQTEIRDRTDEDWANWDDQESRVRKTRIPRTEGATNRQAGYQANPRPNRPDRADRSPNRPPDRSQEVYDAEYRVLIPPYNQPASPASSSAPPPAPPPASSTSADDEDWGLDDEPQDRSR